MSHCGKNSAREKWATPQVLVIRVDPTQVYQSRLLVFKASIGADLSTVQDQYGTKVGEQGQLACHEVLAAKDPKQNSIISYQTSLVFSIHARLHIHTRLCVLRIDQMHIYIYIYIYIFIYLFIYLFGYSCIYYCLCYGNLF